MDLSALLLALAAEVGAARPRAWGDGVTETLRLVTLRLPPRANVFASFVETRRIAGTEMCAVSPATSRKLAPWACDGPAPPWLAAGGSVLSAPALSVARLPGGQVVALGPAPVVVAADGVTVARDLSSRYAPLLHFCPLDLRAALAAARPVAGPAFLLGDDMFPPNYSHWLLDALPRLAALEMAGWGRGATLITGPLTAPYQHETLARLGFGPERIVQLAPGEAARAEVLLATTDQPQPPHPLFKGAPWAARFLRGAFGAAGDGGGRLYLSRADAGWRRVTNEAALIAALAPLGFLPVTLGGRTVAEQAALFAAADHIVAPHGAGLANLVFARPGTKLLEIFPPGFGTPAFYYLAASGGLRYRCHVAATAAAGPADYADFAVDPADIIALME